MVKRYSTSKDAIELYNECEDKQVDVSSSPSGVRGINDDSNVHLSDTEKTIKQLELALWGSEQTVWTWNKATNEIELKSYLESIYDVNETVLTLDDFNVNVHPDDADAFLTAWNALVSGVSNDLCCRTRYFVSNEYRWLEIKGKVSAFDDEGAMIVIGTLSDIHLSIENQNKLTLMWQAFSKSMQPMLILAQNMHIEEYNGAWIAQLDPAETVLHQTSLLELVSITKSDMTKIDEMGFCEKTTDLHVPDQKPVPIELLINRFTLEDTNKQHYIVLIKDLTDSIATEKELKRLATTDQVTGLINKFELQNRLQTYIEDNEAVDVYYIELDGVKEVSDALGHEDKDKLLRKVAMNLSQKLTNMSCLASWGSNEFFAVLPKQTDDQRLESVTNINQIIASSTVINGDQKFMITANIGICKFPDDASNVQDVIRKADAALYYSKFDSDENYSIYSKGMADEIQDRISMVNDLREALESEQLTFVLQGKYNTRRELIGAEVLCRWFSDKYGPVSPGVFIPLIEKYGMEFTLGELAVKNAINYISILDSLGIQIPISVNISATQVLDYNFLIKLGRMLKDAKTPAHLVELEITESVFICDDDSASLRLEALKQLGVRISLDDFGTGYSSLSYLGRFQFDVVKIDRSFIIEIEDDEKALTLFKAIMNICHALKLDVVVEGIETENQFSILGETGVDKFQGFLLGRPLQINDFIDANKKH